MSRALTSPNPVRGSDCAREGRRCGVARKDPLASRPQKPFGRGLSHAPQSQAGKNIAVRVVGGPVVSGNVYALLLARQGDVLLLQATTLRSRRYSTARPLRYTSMKSTRGTTIRPSISSTIPWLPGSQFAAATSEWSACSTAASHRRFRGGRFAYLNGHRLHPAQFGELVARIFYDQTVLDPEACRVTYYSNRPLKAIVADSGQTRLRSLSSGVTRPFAGSPHTPGL